MSKYLLSQHRVLRYMVMRHEPVVCAGWLIHPLPAGILRCRFSAAGAQGNMMASD